MRVVDLFCGLGGSSAGAALAGWEVVGAADKCPRALETYRLNYPTHATRCLDLSDVARTRRWVEGLRPDAILASPPCQSYSTAGREGRDCALVHAVVSVAVAVGVSVLVVENVIPFLSGAPWRSARAELERAGYAVAVCRLKASHLGVPQKRRRAFCVCVRGGDPRAAAALERQAAALARDGRDACVHDALPHLRGRTYYLTGCYKDPSVHEADRPCMTLRTRCAACPGARYRAVPSDAGPVGDAHLFTIPELCALQGLDGYRWPPSFTRSARSRQIGNSVVPACMAWVLARTTPWVPASPGRTPESARVSHSGDARVDRSAGHSGNAKHSGGSPDDARVNQSVDSSVASVDSHVDSPVDSSVSPRAAPPREQNTAENAAENAAED